MKVYGIDIGKNMLLSDDRGPTLFFDYKHAQEIVVKRNQIHEQQSRTIEAELIFHSNPSST